MLFIFKMIRQSLHLFLILNPRKEVNFNTLCVTYRPTRSRPQRPRPQRPRPSRWNKVNATVDWIKVGATERGKSLKV